MTQSAPTVRIDAWTWAVRLYATRSAAAEACRAGHVKINGRSVKPAHAVNLGDVIRAHTPSGDRTVVVTGLIARRVSATVAAEHFEDRTPPRPPKELLPDVGVRMRGSGRPTKRERRDIELSLIHI